MYIYGSTEQFHHLCNIISSTEAPGIESSGSKGNSHHAQIKVSSMISQHEHFSVNHFLSAGGIHCNTGKRRVSMHKEDCHCIGEAGGRSNGTYSNKSTLSLWSSPSEAALRQEGGKRALSEESSFRGLLVSFMTKRAPRKSSSLWEFTQAFGDGGRIIPDTFLYVSSQGEGISSSTGNLVFGTCQSLESIAVNFPRERSSYKWRKQHFFGVAVEFQAAKYPFSLTSLPVSCGSGVPPQRKPIMGEENCWMVRTSATVVLPNTPNAQPLAFLLYHQGPRVQWPVAARRPRLSRLGVMEYVMGAWCQWSSILGHSIAMGDPPVHWRTNCPEAPGGSHASSCQNSCHGIRDGFSVANSLPSWHTQGNAMVVPSVHSRATCPVASGDSWDSSWEAGYHGICDG